MTEEVKRFVKLDNEIDPLDFIMDNENTELDEKENEYLVYIMEHQKNVKNVWDKVKQKLAQMSSVHPKDIKNIDKLIDAHDESKYDLEEFEGFRQWFYPHKDEIKDKKKFKKAFRHHWQNNPHHWEYWIKGDSIEPIPVKYVFEMLCDWTAMSVKFKNKPSEWFKLEENKMIINIETKQLIEALLTLFDDVYDELKINK